MLVASLAVLVFQGGHIGNLVETVGEWSRLPVVALVQAERAREPGGGPTSEEIAAILRSQNIRVPAKGFAGVGPEWKPSRAVKPFEIDLPEMGGGGELARYLRVKAGGEAWAKDGAIAMWDAAWQPSTTVSGTGDRPLPEGWRRASRGFDVSKGRVTIGLAPAQALRLQDMASLEWSKPLKLHWLLAQMWIVAKMKGVPEKQALGTIAMATGGKLIEDKQEWRIELDPQAFRLRAQAAINLLEAEELRKARAMDKGGGILTAADIEVMKSGFALSRSVWRDIDNATILDLFKVSNQALYRPVRRGTPLYATLTKHVASCRDWAQRPPPGKESVAAAHMKLLRMVDWDRDPGIILGQNLGVSAGCARIGGGTVMID